MDPEEVVKRFYGRDEEYQGRREMTTFSNMRTWETFAPRCLPPTLFPHKEFRIIVMVIAIEKPKPLGPRSQASNPWGEYSLQT